MIRIIAAILSVYILILSGIACEDHHDSDFASGSLSLELSADMHDHSGADICNPFFFCHAGHHTFVGEEIYTSQIKTDYSELSEFFKPDYKYSICISIWNPPKA